MQFGLMGGGPGDLLFKDASWDLPEVNPVGIDDSSESTRFQAKHLFASRQQGLGCMTSGVGALGRPNSTSKRPRSLRRQYDSPASSNSTCFEWV